MNLLLAAENLDITLARKLIEDNIDVNETDDFGQTPLHIAIDSAFEEAIYIYDTENRIVEPNMDLIEILISNGADLYKPDSKGKTPMAWAIERKNDSFVEKLKEFKTK